MCLSNYREYISSLNEITYQKKKKSLNEIIETALGYNTGGGWTWCARTQWTHCIYHILLKRTCTHTHPHTDLYTSRTEMSFQNLQKAAERGGYGGERYEQLEFQKKVAKCYQVLHDASWKVILWFMWWNMDVCVYVCMYV